MKSAALSILSATAALFGLAMTPTVSDTGIVRPLIGVKEPLPPKTLPVALEN